MEFGGLEPRVEPRMAFSEEKNVTGNEHTLAGGLDLIGYDVSWVSLLFVE